MTETTPPRDVASDARATTMPQGVCLSYACADDAELSLCEVQGDARVLTGFDNAELLEAPGLWWSRIDPDDRARLQQVVAAARDNGEGRCEYRLRDARGEIRWILDDFVYRDMGGARGLWGVRTDVSRAARAERLLLKLNRALETRRRCDEVLETRSEEPSLLTDFCQAIVERGGYRLAWIGMTSLEGADTRVRPVASGGFEDGYLDTLDITWDKDDPRGRGPTGTAIRERQAAIARDILHDPQFEPWRERALERGYQSSIALPLLIADSEVGVLNIYASEPDAFDPDETRLLSEVAGDLAHALRSTRALRARQEVEQALRESEERFRDLVNAIPHGVQESDVDGSITYANPAMHRILEMPDGALAGHQVWDFLSDEDRESLRGYYASLVAEQPEPVSYHARNFTAGGRPVDLQIDWTYKRSADGELMGFISVITDITEKRRSQEKLDHLAHHDPLTGLPNRSLFNDRLGRAISRARRDQQELAVLFVDVDHFKNINDSLGHPVGDQFLKQVAKRISAALRSSDTVARVGGDEFIVLAEEINTPRDVGILASKLRDCFIEPFTVGEHVLHLTMSIGISLFPRDGADAATLVKNADAAMYRAKDEGRNDFRFYTSDLTATVFERLTLETALRGALARNELRLFYQPQVELETGRVVGLEALLRWQRPDGLVSPAAFIPLAEESGLIIPIGEWVLNTATRKMHALLEAGIELDRMAVNIAAIQIQRAPLSEMVKKALAATGLPAHKLELEITESSIMHVTERNLSVINTLKELGIRLAIDDFGTGYSSLNYLKRLPIQKLKIDQSFVQDVEGDSNDAAITRAVIALAWSLGLNVLAEGVETEAQRDFLIEHGCKVAQGYLYARPMPEDELDEWLRARAG